jgi:hypothetical protein
MIDVDTFETKKRDDFTVAVQYRSKIMGNMPWMALDLPFRQDSI